MATVLLDSSLILPGVNDKKNSAVATQVGTWDKVTKLLRNWAVFLKLTSCLAFELLPRVAF